MLVNSSFVVSCEMSLAVYLSHVDASFTHVLLPMLRTFMEEVGGRTPGMMRIIPYLSPEESKLIVYLCLDII